MDYAPRERLMTREEVDQTLVRISIHGSLKTTEK